MATALVFVFMAAISTPHCPPLSSHAPTVASEAGAIAAARAAWRGTFREDQVQSKHPYRAVLTGGTWHVFGTLPAGWRGGTPEARICALDGRVLSVSHTE